MSSLDDLTACAEAAANAFRKPSFLATFENICTYSPPLPPVPGIYGWYFLKIPGHVPTRRCVNAGGWFHRRTLLYIGISDNLHRRIVTYHFCGTKQNSTLRNKLRHLLDVDEAELSQWMAENALVTWLAEGDDALPLGCGMGWIGDIEKLLI